ncbi:hypothetical protein BJ322DRAFT_804745 [Thelephora terrestris]|uniref:Uncharacterized protein n=1 Tax=Thelephora terrestris TaxID=56493 RepID=A0A9P6L6Z1_9AGAM|nr:hypothetical protein BJ322DRAFT_804745 [Thelephora terrestris]
MDHARLKIVASAALEKAPTGADAVFPQWSGPDPTTVRVQAILELVYFPPCCFPCDAEEPHVQSLYAIDLWLNAAENRSVREPRYGNLKVRPCDTTPLVPLMLQATFLLGYALRPPPLHKHVASVAIYITSFGLPSSRRLRSHLFLQPPFQSHSSLIFRLSIRSDSEHRRIIGSDLQSDSETYSQMKEGWLRWTGMALRYTWIKSAGCLRIQWTQTSRLSL